MDETTGRKPVKTPITEYDKSTINSKLFQANQGLPVLSCRRLVGAKPIPQRKKRIQCFFPVVCMIWSLVAMSQINLKRVTLQKSGQNTLVRKKYEKYEE